MQNGRQAGCGMDARISFPATAARPVKLNGRMYLDGGISDPIPVNWMLSQGYEKNVVVCTRHPDTENFFDAYYSN